MYLQSLTAIIATCEEQLHKSPQMQRDRQSKHQGSSFRYLLRKYTPILTLKIKRRVRRGVYADWKKIRRALQLICTSSFSFPPSIFQQMYLPAPPRWFLAGTAVWGEVVPQPGRGGGLGCPGGRWSRGDGNGAFSCPWTAALPLGILSMWPLGFSLS